MSNHYVKNELVSESQHLDQLKEATKHMTRAERARAYRDAGWWYPEMDDDLYVADQITKAIVDTPHTPTYDEVRKLEKGE